MDSPGAVDAPEWLYFLAVPSVYDVWPTGGSAFNIHDRVPELAFANSDTLRRLALPSNLHGGRASGDVGVLARPHGKTRSIRTDPDAPANRDDVVRWGGGGGFWFIPGWVLDSYLEPHHVSFPSSGVTRVELWGQGRSAPFAGPRFTGKRDTFLSEVAEGARLQVLVIAGSTLAPRIIKPGLILDAYFIERRGSRARVSSDADSAAFQAAHVGRVLLEIPDSITQHPLPGQAIEHLVDVEARARVDQSLYARGKKSRSTPWFITDSETEEAFLQPLFTEHEAMTRFRLLQPHQRHELVVVEEIDRDSDLGDEEVSS